MTGLIKTNPEIAPNPEHREGPVAYSFKQHAAKLSSDPFLWAALGSIAFSLTCKLKSKDKTANFVGQWVPTILILGLYKKFVKTEGSDGR